MRKTHINVIGAGLAGSEAAYQIAKRGIPVKLYEMRGLKQTPQHKTDKLIVLPIKDSNVLKMVQDTLLDSFCTSWHFRKEIFS